MYIDKNQSIDAGQRKVEASDRIRSVLEMLREISANGTRETCSRESLLATMSAWALDLNISRMVKDNLVEEVVDDDGVFYRIPPPQVMSAINASELGISEW